jgi:hypothetical protein
MYHPCFADTHDPTSQTPEKTFGNAVENVATTMFLKKMHREATAEVASGFQGKGREWIRAQDDVFLKAMVDNTNIKFTTKKPSKDMLVEALIDYKKTVGRAAKKVAQGKLINGG